MPANRLVLSLISLISLVASSGVVAQQTEKPSLTAIPAGEATVKLSCDEAQKKVAAMIAGTLPSEEILSVAAALNTCAAKSYNKKQLEEGKEERAITTAYVEPVGGRNTMVFGLVSLSPKDEGSIRMVCSAAGQVVGLVAPDPTITKVVTATGDFACGSYVESLMKSEGIC